VRHDAGTVAGSLNGLAAALGRQVRGKLPAPVVQVLERQGPYIIGTEIALFVNLVAFPPATPAIVRLSSLFVSPLVVIGARIVADHLERTGAAMARRAAPALTGAAAKRVLDTSVLRGGDDVSLAWSGDATIRSLAAISKRTYSGEWDGMLETLGPRGRDLCREVEALEVSFRALAAPVEDFDFAHHVSLFREALLHLAGAAMTLWSCYNKPTRPDGGPLIISSLGAVYSVGEAQALLAKQLRNAESIGDALVQRSAAFTQSSPS
jgi:hypothetical protein